MRVVVKKSQYKIGFGLWVCDNFQAALMLSQKRCIESWITFDEQCNFYLLTLIRRNTTQSTIVKRSRQFAINFCDYNM